MTMSRKTKKRKRTRKKRNKRSEKNRFKSNRKSLLLILMKDWGHMNMITMKRKKKVNKQMKKGKLNKKKSSLKTKKFRVRQKPQERVRKWKEKDSKVVTEARENGFREEVTEAVIEHVVDTAEDTEAEEVELRLVESHSKEKRELKLLKEREDLTVPSEEVIEVDIAVETEVEEEASDLEVEVVSKETLLKAEKLQLPREELSTATSPMKSVVEEATTTRGEVIVIKNNKRSTTNPRKISPQAVLS